MVLISEYLGIPVINNNHDFYWEGGNREVDLANKKLKKGNYKDYLNDLPNVNDGIDILKAIKASLKSNEKKGMWIDF